MAAGTNGRKAHNEIRSEEGAATRPSYRFARLSRRAENWAMVVRLSRVKGAVYLFSCSQASEILYILWIFFFLLLGVLSREIYKSCKFVPPSAGMLTQLLLRIGYL